ncbi:hypothetical protein ASE04_18460 [Rhizobium sp. Root708]|nr:hypothetical protein ASE04_18460 [Rhizobium sp. Root708]
MTRFLAYNTAVLMAINDSNGPDITHSYGSELRQCDPIDICTIKRRRPKHRILKAAISNDSMDRREIALPGTVK